MNWISSPNFAPSSLQQCSCHSPPSHCSRTVIRGTIAGQNGRKATCANFLRYQRGVSLSHTSTTGSSQPPKHNYLTTRFLVADVRFRGRNQNQKRGEKRVVAGQGCLTYAPSWTPLPITCPLRSPKAGRTTWATPQSGLKITAAACASTMGRQSLEQWHFTTPGNSGGPPPGQIRLAAVTPDPYGFRVTFVSTRLLACYALCFAATRTSVPSVAPGFARVSISVQLDGLRSRVRKFESCWGRLDQPFGILPLAWPGSPDWRCATTDVIRQERTLGATF